MASGIFFFFFFFFVFAMNYCWGKQQKNWFKMGGIKLEHVNEHEKLISPSSD